MTIKRKILALHYALNLVGRFVSIRQISDRLSCNYQYAWKIISETKEEYFEDEKGLPSKINTLCPYCSK